jgi:hypothetical protein
MKIDFFSQKVNEENIETSEKLIINKEISLMSDCFLCNAYSILY